MDWLGPIIRQLADLGRWAPVIFVAVYVVASIVPAPAFLLTFAAGAVVGLWRGTLLLYLGAVLGSSAVYALAAPLARSRVLRWVDRDPGVGGARRAVVGRRAWMMLLLGLARLVPYNFVDGALALSGVRCRGLLRGAVGRIPAVVMYGYYGEVVGG